MKLAVSMSISHTADREMDFVRHTYITFLDSLGFVPLLVPNAITDLGAYVAALDVGGVVLTGGGDIHPARYHQPTNGAVEISPQRDEVEFRLLQIALDRGLPVLGICRGWQVINVFFGGGLVQDIPSQIGAAVLHDESQHPVALTDPRLIRLLGVDALITNSFHHQGATADLLAPGLEIFARSEADGIIEGGWHVDHPVLGVQWHPERGGSPSREADHRLVRALFDQGMFWK